MKKDAVDEEQIEWRREQASLEERERMRQLRTTSARKSKKKKKPAMLTWNAPTFQLPPQSKSTEQMIDETALHVQKLSGIGASFQANPMEKQFMDIVLHSNELEEFTLHGIEGEIEFFRQINHSSLKSLDLGSAETAEQLHKLLDGLSNLERLALRRETLI